jgi:hypothetical protein
MTFHDLEQMGFFFWDTGDQLKNHIYQRSREAFAKSDALRDEIQSVEALHSGFMICCEYSRCCANGLISIQPM